MSKMTDLEERIISQKFWKCFRWQKADKIKVRTALFKCISSFDPLATVEDVPGDVMSQLVQVINSSDKDQKTMRKMAEDILLPCVARFK